MRWCFFLLCNLLKALQCSALSRSSVDLVTEWHFTEQARFLGLRALIRKAPLERIKAGGGVSQETPVPSGAGPTQRIQWAHLHFVLHKYAG